MRREVIPVAQPEKLLEHADKEVRDVLINAREIATKEGKDYVDGVSILISMLEMKEGVFYKALKDIFSRRGLDFDDYHQSIIALPSEPRAVKSSFTIQLKQLLGEGNIDPMKFIKALYKKETQFAEIHLQLGITLDDFMNAIDKVERKKATD